MEKIVVAGMYKFVALPDWEELRTPLLDRCRAKEIKGSILLAPEGINGTIAGAGVAVDDVLAYLREDPRLSDLQSTASQCDHMPFKRMKVRLRRELISLGQPAIDPRERVGTYVEPGDWNRLITDPEVLVIDTRNDYEVEIGTFKEARDPRISSFGDFPSFVRENLGLIRGTRVAMFCTGGIRCEKATSYLLDEGYEQVYHLKGGILKYLQEIPPDESLWEGECFVFDERVSVGHGLEPGTYEACHGCGRPVSAEDMDDETYELGVSCPHCYENLTAKQRTGFRERQRQVELAQQHRRVHLGESAPSS